VTTISWYSSSADQDWKAAHLRPLDSTIGLAPLGHALPEDLTCVPLADMPPSCLVVAWNSANTNPLIHTHRHGHLPLGRSSEMTVASQKLLLVLLLEA
jgi:hypothetical protein